MYFRAPVVMIGYKTETKQGSLTILEKHNLEMKIFSTSLLCLFASAHGYQEIDPAVKSSIAAMDPFQMSLKEVFILGKLLRKGADSLTSARLNQAFSQVKPTEIELQAFYNLQQLLLKKATNMDEGRLALLGLEKSTIAYPDFFTEDTGLSQYRQSSMLKAKLERETEKQLMAGPLGHLKSGEATEDKRHIRKSKGLEFFLDIRNMGFDQQWKIGEWFKLHPTARLTKR